MEKIYDFEKNRVTDGNEVTWKDLVCVNGKVYAEEFPIENEFDEDVDGGPIFRIDMFTSAVAEKYGCEPEDITTHTMDGENFDESADLPDGFYQSGALAFGAESCGAYINGEEAEFFLDEDLFDEEDEEED
jgi:hypothetical protein